MDKEVLIWANKNVQLLEWQQRQLQKIFFQTDDEDAWPLEK